MRFVCLGCFDQAMFNALSAAEQATIIDRCFAYDDELRRGGHFVEGVALQETKKARTVHLRGGKPIAVDGPFAETKEFIGGLMFLEARDLDEAVALISKHPGLAMGPFEIRPVNEEVTAMCNARAERIAANVLPTSA
jgi:hypothetical protein